MGGVSCTRFYTASSPTCCSPRIRKCSCVSPNTHTAPPCVHYMLYMFTDPLFFGGRCSALSRCPGTRRWWHCAGASPDRVGPDSTPWRRNDPPPFSVPHGRPLQTDTCVHEAKLQRSIRVLMCRCLTFAFVFFLLLFAELVQREVIEVEAVKVPRQNLGQGFHGERPLGNKLLPTCERGENRQQLVPKISGDQNIQVPFNPRNNQGLRDRQTGEG